MTSRVSSLGAVTAADLAAGQAHPKMDPTCAGMITGRAGPRRCRNRPHVEDMRAIPMRERALER
jgi:hypothetical protein